MTGVKQKEKAKNGARFTFLSLLALCCTMYFALLVSGNITDGIIEGMRIAALTVLPSSFPFMIVSDLYYAYGYPERISSFGKLTRKVFHLPESSVRALILGNVAGFPIGAKIAAELYTGGGIDKKNAEKLIAYSNNPSVAFTVSCVGVSILNDLKIGIFLLTLVYISTLITALIYRERELKCTYITPVISYRFSFVKSVREAGAASITILSFIVTFFGIISILKLYLHNGYLLALLSSILELTSAVTLTAPLALPETVKLVIIAFSLGFGGLSVMMQSAVFSSCAGLSLKPYFKIKLTEGLICATLCAVFCRFV